MEEDSFAVFFDAEVWRGCSSVTERTRGPFSGPDRIARQGPGGIIVRVHKMKNEFTC